MCLWTPLNGSEMSSSASTGTLKVLMGSAVVPGWDTSCVLVLTVGPSFTEIILRAEILEAAEWPGKSDYRTYYNAKTEN